MPGTPNQRRLLVVASNLALLRAHYQDVIIALARSGVAVRIRYVKENLLDPEEFRAGFREAGVDVTVDPLPRFARRPADLFALRLRELGNILRFSHPDYTGRTVLSERALLKTAPGSQRWGQRLRHLGPRASARAARVLAWIESTLPPPSFAVSLVDEERPDAIAVSPVIRVPALVDFLKAGRHAGISTAIWVQSWDNLTNKGLLHFTPDRVFVWNTKQEEELARYHGVPGERVCVTGAQSFDHWFDGTAVVERGEFCARMGVDSGKPIILYLASSKQIAPDEPTFFARWLAAVRSSDDPVLRTSTVLVRPHPTLARSWHDRGFDRESGVAVSPSTLDEQINSTAFRERYRAELHHACVAVGINTSGFIDAAIFGKPCCTVELPELFHGQRGTVHFQHLARPDGGLLQIATSLDEHTGALSELVRRDSYARDERSEAFVRAFVRPQGLDVRPADVFVSDMWPLLELRSQVLAPTGIRRMLGSVLAHTAAVVGAPLEESPFWSLIEHLFHPFATALRRLRGVPTNTLDLASAKARRKLGRQARRRIRQVAFAIARRLLPRPVRVALRRRLSSGASPSATPLAPDSDTSGRT
jgi:hypothetical protein